MTKNNANCANPCFRFDLWRAADALCSNMDGVEYKHVVLGLIFHNCISDSFEVQHGKLEAERAAGSDPEDTAENRSVHVFWAPTSTSGFAHKRQQFPV
jgi:type I restriction-modification system DNA methylase subunit